MITARVAEPEPPLRGGSGSGSKRAAPGGSGSGSATLYSRNRYQYLSMAPEENTDIYLFHFRKYDNMSTRETNMVIIVLFICFHKCKLISEEGETIDKRGRGNKNNSRYNILLYCRSLVDHFMNIFLYDI